MMYYSGRRMLLVLQFWCSAVMWRKWSMPWLFKHFPQETLLGYFLLTVQPGVGVCEMAVFQVVLDCILLSCSLINWLWIKQLLQQQTVSSSSQRVIKEKILTSLPCLSHLHPLDCLSSFFCWRKARISMNCHFLALFAGYLTVTLFQFNNTVMISRSDKCVSSALCHSPWFQEIFIVGNVIPEHYASLRVS